MHRRFSRLLLAISLIATTVVGASPTAAAPPVSPPSTFAALGTYATGLADIAAGVRAAEIVAAAKDRLYVTNASHTSIDIVDIADPAAPTLIKRVDLSAFGGSVTSVAVARAVIAVAVPASVETDPGTLVFLDAKKDSGAVIGQATVGSLPDMVTFTPNGKFAVVANEGQPNSYGQPDSVDPVGSVSVVDVHEHTRKNANPKARDNVTIGFADFNVGGPRHAELPAGVRIYGPGASVAQDLEPEYVTIEGNGRTAYVSLQENNAIAKLDLHTGRVEAIWALGFKNHNVPGSGLDPSDQDGAIRIAPWPVHGLYQPDGIANVKIKGRTFVLSANEGDFREYPGYDEEVRVGSGSYVLDPTVFPDAATLKLSANLGRLNVSRATGDVDDDGNFERIELPGARSFSIWSDTGQMVWDSGDQFERITAAVNPAFFNSNNSGDNFDNRSDNKGPEPEGIAVGQFGKHTLAIIGLERVGGLMIYDISDPAAPDFVQYLNNRTFGGPAIGPDSGPEGIVVIDKKDSPTRETIFAVANEVTGTVTLYGQVPPAPTSPDGAGTLTLLHNNDGESSLLPFHSTVSGVPFRFGGVSAFSAVTDREIAEARSMGNSVLNVYAGDALLASSTLACSAPGDPGSVPILDAVAQRQIPYDAHIIGNHEFDFFPAFLREFILDFEVKKKLTQPFLSANLDFSGEPSFDALVDADGLIVGSTSDGRVVAKSLLHIDPVTGGRFGVVGATTWTLPTVSSPGNVGVTLDAASTAAAVQAEIDRLWAMGVRKIIFVSHLQNANNDLALIPLLRHIDIAVAGGGDELLASPGDRLLPGEGQPIFGTYPLQTLDADGRTVHVVTTSGNYKYLGRLDATFDAAGEVSSINEPVSGPVRVIPSDQPIGGDLAALGAGDAVVRDPAIVASVEVPLTECLAEFQTPIARTEVRINVAHSGDGGLGFANGVRNGETNGGNLVTDAFIHQYETHAASVGLPTGPGVNLVAVQNGGGIRQNAGNVLPVGGTVPGTITRQNTLDVLAFFTNVVTAVPNVTPAELKEILERAAAALPGSAGQFLQISGMDVTYDLGETAQIVSAPAAGLQYGTITTAGSRVQRVELSDGTVIIDGGAIVPGAPDVTIVTNSFTAFQGGDNYPTFALKGGKVNLPGNYETALVDYLGTFPVVSGLPTIPAADARYALPAGEGRITIVP